METVFVIFMAFTSPTQCWDYYENRIGKTDNVRALCKRFEMPVRPKARPEPATLPQPTQGSSVVQ